MKLKLKIEDKGVEIVCIGFDFDFSRYVLESIQSNIDWVPDNDDGTVDFYFSTRKDSTTKQT